MCPSNSVVSIGAIFSVSGIRESLRRNRAVKVVVSSTIGDVLLRVLLIASSWFRC
jgi:2-phospho-L-lactate transferase/gluconeogenesis factor (CofD/UPF0052 family)